VTHDDSTECDGCGGFWTITDLVDGICPKCDGRTPACQMCGRTREELASPEDLIHYTHESHPADVEEGDGWSNCRPCEERASYCHLCGKSLVGRQSITRGLIEGRPRGMFAPFFCSEECAGVQPNGNKWRDEGGEA
jgi:hypothetical protein